MLSPDDAILARGDDALHGLSTILSEQSMTEIVRGLACQCEITGLTANYVRYKPGTSCLVGFAAHVEGGTVPVYARTHATHSRVKLAKAVTREGLPGPLGFGAAAVRGPALAVYEIPNDHELRGLPRLLRAEPCRLRLADVTFGEHAVSDSLVTTLRYKPERRFVSRLDSSGRRAVLKVYTEEDFAATRDRSKRFRSQGALVVVEAIGRRERHNALLFPWIEGESLLAMAARNFPQALAAAHRIGEAVQIVHAHEPGALPECTSATVDQWMRATCDSVRGLDREASELAAAVGADLRAGLATFDWPATALHGDFSCDQIIVADGAAAILDFDRAARGHPLLDLGRFAASLELETLHGGINSVRRDELIAAFVAGYGVPVPGGDSTFNAFTAAHLLLKADEPFRHRWQNWRAQIRSIVHRAGELCGSGCLAGR